MLCFKFTKFAKQKINIYVIIINLLNTTIHKKYKHDAPQNSFISWWKPENHLLILNFFIQINFN